MTKLDPDEPKIDQDWFIDTLKTAEATADDAARIALWQAACQAHPESGLAYVMLGAEHAQTGDYARAEDAYCRAVLIAPEVHIARFQLGLLQFCDNRVAIALLSWQPLLALPDTNPLKIFAGGFMALAQNDLAGALAMFRDGIAKDSAQSPLSRDIQKVINRLQGEPAHAETEPTNYDFLLANYRDTDTLH